MRRVSGESRRLSRRARRPGVSRGSALAAGSSRSRRSRVCGSSVAVAIAHPVERLYLRELVVGGLEFLPQALDVAVDRAVVDVDVLAVGAVHQLVAALHVAGPESQRLQDQELRHRKVDALALPGALV